MSSADIFEISRNSDRLTLVFSSTMANVDRACELCLDFLRNMIKDYADHFFSIHLVMREGLTNAVKHGNRLDSHKIVRCYIRIESGNLIYMEIEDQGKGFDWKKELRKQVNDEAEHGRGLKIMKHYFSRYIYNELGNRLILEKRLSR